MISNSFGERSRAMRFLGCRGTEKQNNIYFEINELRHKVNSLTDTASFKRNVASKFLNLFFKKSYN